MDRVRGGRYGAENIGRIGIGQRYRRCDHKRDQRRRCGDTQDKPY